MKTKTMTIVCAAAIALASTSPTFASPDPDPAAVAADAVIMRPLLFAATVGGSVIFVVCLPIAAISKSVKSTAQMLVVGPAKATFTRPLGDFDYPKESSESDLALDY